jgi:hypothetical protein
MGENVGLAGDERIERERAIPVNWHVDADGFVMHNNPSYTGPALFGVKVPVIDDDGLRGYDICLNAYNGCEGAKDPSCFNQVCSNHEKYSNCRGRRV